MHRFLVGALILGALIVPAPAVGQAAPPAAAAEQRPPADPKDVESIDAIIAALYDVISGPAGQARNWDRMRSLFVPGARLMPVQVRPAAQGAAAAEASPARVAMLSVDDYIRLGGPLLERDGFFEREIGRRTETFGHIAHVFSAYDSKRTKDDAQPFARGINSIQLMHDGTRWWVVSIFWDSERPGQPIPPQYIATP